MLSYIQDLILTNLLGTNEGVRYSQIKPKDIDNDLFNYHLQELVKKGYVEKEDMLYSLSQKGKEYIHNVDVAGKIYTGFKVSVLAYVTNPENQILLQKRKRHPYYGDVGVISGKVLLGERIEDAASRKLLEETGLSCKFKFLGILRKVRKNNENQIFEDALFHVCYGENPTGDLIEENDYGENHWADRKEALELQDNNITFGDPSFMVMKNILNGKLLNGNPDTFYIHEELILRDF